MESRGDSVLSWQVLCDTAYGSVTSSRKQELNALVTTLRTAIELLLLVSAFSSVFLICYPLPISLDTIV